MSSTVQLNPIIKIIQRGINYKVPSIRTNTLHSAICANKGSFDGINPSGGNVTLTIVELCRVAISSSVVSWKEGRRRELLIYKNYSDTMELTIPSGPD